MSFIWMDIIDCFDDGRLGGLASWPELCAEGSARYSVECVDFGPLPCCLNGETD